MYELFIKAKWGERKVKMLSWYIEILIVPADFLTCLNKIHFFFKDLIIIERTTGSDDS